MLLHSRGHDGRRGHLAWLLLLLLLGSISWLLHLLLRRLHWPGVLRRSWLLLLDLCLALFLVLLLDALHGVEDVVEDVVHVLAVELAQGVLQRLGEGGIAGLFLRLAVLALVLVVEALLVLQALEQILAEQVGGEVVGQVFIGGVGSG